MCGRARSALCCVECLVRKDGRFLRVTADEPRALLKSSTMYIGPGSRECVRLEGGCMVAPVVKHGVPVVFSSCISSRFNSKMLGVAPTRSVGSCYVNLGCGLSVVGVLGGSKAMGRLNKGFRKRSHFRYETGVLGRLERLKLLIGRIPCVGGVKCSREAGSVVRPGLSAR